MAQIDLASILDNFSKLQHVSVVGRVAEKLSKPANVFSDVVCDCVFYRFECLAVRIPNLDSYFKNNCIYSSSGWYFVNGDFIISGPPTGLAGWQQLFGTMYRGVTDKSKPSYYSMLGFTRNPDKSWVIKPVMSELPDMYDPDIKKYMKDGLEVLQLPTSCKDLRLFTSDLGIIPQREYIDIQEEIIPEDDNFVLECRTAPIKANSAFTLYKMALHEAEQRFYKFSTSLDGKYTLTDTGEIRTLVKRLIEGRAQGSYVVTQCLSAIPGMDKPIEGVSMAEYLARHFDEASKRLTDKFSKPKIYNKGALEALNAFNEPDKIYAGLIAVICGISVENMFRAVERIKYPASAYIPKNPYLLCLLGGMSTAATERVAAAFGKHEDPEVRPYRVASYAVQLFDDAVSASDSSTLCQVRVLDNVGLLLTDTQLIKMRSSGNPFGDAMSRRVEQFLNRKIKYSPETFDYNLRRETDVLKYFIEFGLGCVVGRTLTSRKLLEQELYVHERMYAMAETHYDYPADKIDEYIDDYERMRHITLEERQRDAVHLCAVGGACVAGGAGSGKTTTMECFVYVLEQLDPGIEVRFAAPTGRAAKRIQEVTKHEAKTLHREFNLFYNDEEEDKPENIVYIIDEASMLTLDLVYRSLKSMGKGCRAYFFGDIYQLPPIGRGLPFKDMLRFMPSVILNVSKRAAVDSMINYNSKAICEGRSNLRDGKDFIIVPAPDSKIADVCYNICRHYLSSDSCANYPDVPGVEPSDIQVVTPYRKRNYVGTVALNDRLEPLFNRNRGMGFSIDNMPFRIGDRVVHSDSNCYNMRWYKCEGKDCYSTIGTNAGITNGEVGVIKDFICSERITLSVLEEVDHLRDDRSFKGSNRYFIVVEYLDVMSGETYNILYRALLSKNSSSYGKPFFGEDTSYLNLFYAGTTHKMQGGEAKVVIAVLPSLSGRGGFITREMLNTMITRGKRVVFLVGATDKIPKVVADRSTAGVRTVGEEIVCVKTKS